MGSSLEEIIIKEIRKMLAEGLDDFISAPSDAIAAAKYVADATSPLRGGKPTKPTNSNSKAKAFYARKARIQKKLSAKHGIGLAQIQKLLKLKPDGRYGPNTYRAIKAFQKKYKFKVDGLVGGETIVAMRKANKGIKAASDKVGTEMTGFTPGKGGKVTAGSYDTMSWDQLKKKRLELYRQVIKLEKTEGGTKTSAKARQVYDNIVAAMKRKKAARQKKITDDPRSAESRTKRGAAELEKRKAARKGRR